MSKPEDITLKQELQEIANKHNCLIMSFVATAKPVKTSPVDYNYAQITVEDLYTIEKKIEELQKSKVPENLHLIIHTPGGDAHAATKIAKYLRSIFKKI